MAPVTAVKANVLKKLLRLQFLFNGKTRDQGNKEMNQEMLKTNN
jgi:hypothetical protein